MITFGCYDNEGKWWTVDEIKNATLGKLVIEGEIPEMVI